MPEVSLESPAPPADQTSQAPGSADVNSIHFFHRRHTHLFGNGREFHNVKRLIVGRGALINVDDHGCSSLAAEESLEELCEFALSERNVAALDSEETRIHCLFFSTHVQGLSLFNATLLQYNVKYYTVRLFVCCEERLCTFPG